MTSTRRRKWVTDLAALETIFRLGELKQGDEVLLREVLLLPGYIDPLKGICTVQSIDPPGHDDNGRLCVFVVTRKRPDGVYVNYSDIVAWRMGKERVK